MVTIVYATFVQDLRGMYDPATLLNISGLIIGMLFGALAEATGFCMRAAIVETIDQPSDRPRIRLTQYLAALLAAVAITQALALSGTVDLSRSIYWSAPLSVTSLLIGGLTFGMGMILANGCPGRHLVLLATGSARSLLTVTVLGLAAYATLRGILAYPRLGVEALLPNGLLPVGLAQTMSLPQSWLAAVVSAALAGSIVWLGRKAGPAAVAGGLCIGAVVGLGWWATGYLGADEFEPPRPASLSFTAPIGETIVYLLLFTGETLRFGVAMVFGVVAGALLSAVLGGRFQVRGFTSELAELRYGAGAVLMGFGAVLALGCNIGQSLTGLSTLATGSVIATSAIVAGACLMLALERRFGRASGAASTRQQSI